MKRRKFIKITAAAAPLVSIFPADLSSLYRSKETGQIEKRTLGRTGEKLSILGLGGVVIMDNTPDQASEYVNLAIKHGINYFDVAPTYGDAEIKLGPALEPYRSDVFLACKTQERKRDGVLKELDKSLKNLKTDHFDLYQLHAVRKLEDVDTILGKDGAIKAFVEAREQGKIRYIGFSAHSVEAAMALMDRFDFDTILFPINYAIWHAGNFGPQVLEKAKGKGMGILAIKSMARRPWPENTTEKIPKCWYEPLTNPEEALMGLRFTLSHPVTSAIPPGNEKLFKMALDLVKRFKPLEPSEVIEMKEKGAAEKPLFTYPM